jgi:pyrroline-5-carboxylate reductase
MHSARLSFIGGGNLTRSIVWGLVDSGYPASLINIADRNANKCEKLRSDFGVGASPDVKEAVDFAEILTLSIKPQSFGEFARGYASVVKEKSPLVLSVMAGVNIPTLATSFGLDVPIVRAMPNTASQVKAGATGLYANDHVSSQQKDQVEEIFRNLGVVAWVDKEIDMNAVIAIAASSPAYFLYLTECMQKVGIEMGLDEKTASLLSLQSAYGAAKMGLQSPDSAAELRAKITSKGGTTNAAISEFEACEFSDTVKRAMEAAFNRGVEMEQEHQRLLGSDD